MINDVKKNAEQKMQKSVETLKHDLAKVRTGRAHTGLLDHIRVDYYGTMMPVNQVANVTLVDARTIGVQPFEKKMIGVVEKAIRDSDLGLNPATSGELIRVPMPALTEERRRDLTKVVHKEAEAAKIAVRNVRRDANEHLKKMLKDKECAEDDERHAQVDVQKLTDRYIAEIDKLLQAKEADLMAVLRTSRRPRPPRSQRLAQRLRLHEFHPRRPGGAADPPPRRHHHGRQRPLGAQSPAAARRWPSQGCRGGAQYGTRRDAARHRVPDVVRVFQRELAPARR
jgi:ribosome recycling factor